MRIPFKFRPRLINTLFFTEQTSLTDTAAPLGGALDTGAADSSPVMEASDAVSSNADGATVSDVAEGSKVETQEDDALKDIPTLEELETLVRQNVPHAKNVAQLRTAYEALKQAHQPLKATFEPWQPLTEKYSDPAEVQTNLELFEALSSPLLNNGQPVFDENQLPRHTAAPFIAKYAEKDPAGASRLIDAALQTIQVENGIKDTAVNWYLRDKGIDPNDLDNYKAWKEQGAPVATEAVDLSLLPAKYHDVFKQLPPYIQKDRMDMPEEARNWQLEQDFQSYQGRMAQESFQRQQAAEMETNISTATDKAIDGKFQDGFNQFLQQVSSWQPTANPEVNKAYHLELASSLVNLLDSRMEFANKMLLDAAGIPFDSEIQSLNEAFQRNQALAERYKAHNARNGNQYSREFAEAQKSADRDYLRLTQKIHGVSAKLMEFKNKVAKTEAGAEAAANLSSRPAINGQPAGNNGSQTANPQWFQQFVRTA